MHTPCGTQTHTPNLQKFGTKTRIVAMTFNFPHKFQNDELEQSKKGKCALFKNYTCTPHKEIKPMSILVMMFILTNNWKKPWM